MKLVGLDAAIDAICRCRKGGRETIEKLREENPDDYTYGLIRAIDAVQAAANDCACFNCRYSKTAVRKDAYGRREPHMRCTKLRRWVEETWCCGDYVRWRAQDVRPENGTDV